MASGRLKRVLLYTVLVVVAIGVSATIGLIRKYDQATRIDRSIPEVVVGEFVQAYLNDRDDARAQLFSCDGLGGLDDIAQLRTGLERQEAQYDTHVVSVLGRSTVSADGRTVDTDIEFRRGSGALTVKDLQRWRFTLRDEDGWRVCSAEQLPDPSPTPTPTATPPTAS